MPLLVGCLALLLAVVTWLPFSAAGADDVPRTGGTVGSSVSHAESKVPPRADEDTHAPLERTVALASPSADTRLLVTTFLDGVAFPTVLLRVDTPPVFGLKVDWSSQAPEHRIARFESPVCYALLGKGALIEILDSSRVPTAGDLRIDLRRGKSLQVHLTNVPPGIRDHLGLFAQTRYGDEAVAHEAHIKTAAYALRVGFAVEMPTDFLELPLVLARGGTLVVHAQGKTSPKMFRGNAVPFDFANPRVDVDVSALAAFSTLATLNITLAFPHVHPSGKMRLSVDGLDGNRIWQEQFERQPTDREVVVVLRNLPLTIMDASIEDIPGNAPTIRLSQWHVKAVEHQVRCVVEAEGSLTVNVAGSGPEDVLSLQVWDSDGKPVNSRTLAKGAQSHTIEHLAGGRTACKRRPRSPAWHRRSTKCRSAQDNGPLWRWSCCPPATWILNRRRAPTGLCSWMPSRARTEGSTGSISGSKASTACGVLPESTTCGGMEEPSASRSKSAPGTCFAWARDGPLHCHGTPSPRSSPPMRELLLALCLLLNVATFALFGIDKWRSRRPGKNRIRERTLLCCVFLGGFLGAWLAMGLFRHKTMKQPFRIYAILWTLLSPAWLLVFWV